MLCICSLPLLGREKDTTPYGMGLTTNLPFPPSEVEPVVRDVVQDGIIRGSKEYNKEQYITGAESATWTKVFPAWTEGGKVFYKVRYKCLDPRNFKDGSDVGTLAVRYVLIPQGDKNTVLRIDALFVEDFRHSVHLSNGSVEGEEYKDIHDRLDAAALIKAQAAETEKEKQELATRPVPANVVNRSPVSAASSSSSSGSGSPATAVAVTPRAASESTNTASQAAPPNLEQHVKDLRRQVERVVRAPGAGLKSAPFHTASTLQSLPTGTEVLIVISTPYWLGVETHDGQHGWIMRDELDMLP